jgi:hypothetical protein
MIAARGVRSRRQEWRAALTDAYNASGAILFQGRIADPR